MHKPITLAFRLSLSLAMLAALAVAPASHAEPAGSKDGPGIAILASAVDNGQSVEDIMAFVKAARVRDVVIDWAWITLHWDRTKFDRVNELVKQLKSEKVNVAAMYRPRFKGFEADKYKVKAQVGADGKLPDGREILYADEEARKWGAQWAVDILTKCPEFDEVVIYNPSQSDQSAASVAARKDNPDFDNDSVHKFLEQTREAMRKVKKDAKLGMVRPPSEALFKPFRDVVDVDRPYVFVRQDADYTADMDAALEIMKQTKTAGPALAKCVWGPDDKVTDKWLADFIQTARDKKLRYCLWTYDAIFLEDRYDLESLCKAAGLDADKLKPIIRDLGGKTDLPADPEEVQKAIDAAMASDYMAVREVAVKYGEDAIDALGRILDDDKRSVFDRWRAAGALGVTQSNKALPALLRNSKDKEDMVRWLCADALGMCGRGSKEARKRLEEMAENDPAKRADANGKEVFYVRDTAKLALAQLDMPAPRAALDLNEDDAFIKSLPWCETIEDALEQAREEGKLTVVFINPFNSGSFDCGYRAARAYADKQRAASATPPVSDVGLLKERAMLVGLLAEPRAAAFIKQRCVPVRMRLSVQHWTDIYDSEPHALEAIEMDDKDVGAPAVLMISPKGKVVAHARNMTVFAPELFWRIVGVAVEAGKPKRPDALNDAVRAWTDQDTAENFFGALSALIDAGELEDFRKFAALAKPDYLDGASLLLAEVDLLQGNVQAAGDRLDKAIPGDTELELRRSALLAEALIRLGRAEEAAKVASEADGDKPGTPDWAARLGFFEFLANYQLGNPTEPPKATNDLWSARVSLYTTSGGPNPEDWCRYSNLDLPDELHSTEIGLNKGGNKTESKAAIERAALYLLDRQRPDGCWEGPVGGNLNRSGQSMTDAHQVARNALCVMALNKARPEVGIELHKRIEAAIRKGAQAVADWCENPQDNVFALVYALQMEVDLYADRKSKEKKAAAERVKGLIAKLRELEHDGGWTYTNNPPGRLHTFQTAPIMLALRGVAELKIDKVDDMQQRGQKFLESQRVGDLAVFHYGAAMQHLTKVDDTKSSSMRNTVCELALLRAGFSKDKKRLRETIELFWKHLDDVRRTAKRWESFFEPDAMQDAYHYYFGAWYAADAMVELKDKSGAKKLAKALLATQEIDGGFCDGQVSCARNSGTAMALLALLYCGEAG